MQFIDLAAQQNRIRKQIEENISKTLDHGKYIMGPEVGQLEEELKTYVGARHAIACASGTDALLLALMAEGVGPGDAIFTSPFTFIATAEVISLLGATPVFVDIDETTYNMDPEKLEYTRQRVDLIYELQQKHKVRTIDELIEIKEELSNKLKEINEFDDMDFIDEHSLDIQRYFHTLCLIYGSDSDNYNSLLSEIDEEYKTEREDTCIEEYDNISRNWLTYLNYAPLPRTN